jgi:hypothetical protein
LPDVAPAAGVDDRCDDARPVELFLFDEVGDALRGMIPDTLGSFRYRAHRYGIKVWFGTDTPRREHYEAQVLSADAVAGAKTLALEVGFHAEHPKLADNEALLADLVRREPKWRRAIGNDAVAGPFLGRGDVWRRVSETWPDPDLEDAELPVEVAARLVDYMRALEPLLRARSAG